MNSSKINNKTIKNNRPVFPSYRGFAVLATAYRDAADAIRPNLRSGEIRPGDYVGMAIIPFVFLCFRSIELSLKAVLVFDGASEEKIVKKLGHDLSSLLDEFGQDVSSQCLGIDTSAESMLRQYSDKYSHKWFEYSEDFWSEPDIELLHRTCHRACEGASKYIRRAIR